ncbi:MAG: LPS translocon maturation chaperone LptM [Pseudohongiellaceae bacterium]
MRSSRISPGTPVSALVHAFIEAQSDMKTSRRYRTALWYAGMVLLACLASGCGQKGGLTRPESPTASNL